MILRTIGFTLLLLIAGPALAEPEPRDFETREDAEGAAAELRERGVEFSIEEVSVIRPGSRHSVQLRGFPRWTDAQQASNRLRERGIDNFVFTLQQERGYAVGAGVFSDIANAEEVMFDILDAGYREVYILRLPVTVTRYRLVERRSGVMRFGDTSGDASPAQPVRAAMPDRRLHAGLDSIHLEGGWLTDSGNPANSSNYLRTDIHARMDLAPDWEAYASARVHAWHQGGDPDFRRGELDYGDTWLRHRGERHRLTVGAQTVLWGRVDEIPPTDRLSVHDATRFALDGLSERRRSVPAIRFEHFHGNFKTDLLWVPAFRAAELPHRDSIWHPVDRRNGRLIGIEPDPLLADLVTNADFRDDDSGHGGVGIRLSQAGRGFDYAMTLQSARHSLPYYEFTQPATFTARHPRTTVIGGDFGLAVGSSTWRFEAAWLSDVPVTTQDLRMETVRGIDWVAGVEFYPGDADTRVNVQLASQHLLNTPDILDRHDIHAINGEIEMIFANYRWRGSLRYSIGLDAHDVYLNPELAWIAHEPHEFYLAWHYLDGDDDTPGGFYQANDLLTLGWRARF